MLGRYTLSAGGVRGLSPRNALTQFAALFAGGETGDIWRFDSANSNLSGSAVLNNTGIVNGLVLNDGVQSPTIVDAGGFEGIYFDGFNDILAIDFGEEIPQPGTIIISAPAMADGGGAVIVGSDGAGTTSRWGLNRTSSSDLTAYAGSTGLASKRRPVTEPMVMAIEFNGANSRILINGVEVATGDMGTATTDYLTFGGWSDSGSEWTGTLFGAMFIDRVLTDEELDYAQRLLGSYGGIEWPEGVWETMFDGGLFTVNSGGWNGYTWMQRVPAASLIDVSGDQLRIALQAASNETLTISAATVGIEGATNFLFDTAPEIITWDGGSTSVTITPNHVKWSDPIDLPLDGTEDIVIRLRPNGGTGADGFRYSSTMNGVQTQFRAGVDETQVVGALGGSYTAQNAANPIRHIVVL